MELNSHNLDSDKMQGKDAKIISLNYGVDYNIPIDGGNTITEIDGSQSEPLVPIPADDHSDKVIYNAVELMAMGNIEPQYLMEPIFPQKGCAVLAGKPDTGKSQFARQLCIQVALGEKRFLDFELNPIHSKAIYVATEDNQEASTYLLSKQFKGLDREVVENLRFMFADTMEQGEILKELDKALTKESADLVVVDSYGDIFLGNDGNNNMAMRNTVKSFDKIAKKHNCLILFVHHINKGGYRQSPGQEHIQGGSGLVQKVRLAIQLSEGDGGTRYFSVVKGNYCPKEYKQNSLVLNFSEDTFLFTNTGKTIPTNQIGGVSNTTSNKEKITEFQETAETILGQKSITYSSFVQDYCKLTGRSTATAKRVIKDWVKLGIIEKNAGEYCLAKATDDVEEDSEEENKDELN